MEYKGSVVYIEDDWLHEYKLDLVTLKQGDYLIFEMEPSYWDNGKFKFRRTKILFLNKRPCISKKFHDKFFYGARYIRIKNKIEK